MDINEAIAHIEIRQVLCTYARGVDRTDLDARLSIYHPEGTDEHGTFFSGPGSDFAQLVQDNSEGETVVGQHHMTNVYIEFDDEDNAKVESYYLAFHPYEKDGEEKLGIMAGRYLDHFQRRDGAWRIASRVVMTDFTREHLLGAPYAEMVGQFPEGKKRADGDASYEFFGNGS